MTAINSVFVKTHFVSELPAAGFAACGSSERRSPDPAITALTIVSLPQRLHPMSASVDCGGCTATAPAGSVALAHVQAGMRTISVRPS
jgi:hypothetical protein